MGKKKDKTGKLPKTIAGVKLPKAARRQAERAIAELKKPIVREMVLGAVGMAASAMAKQAGAMRNKANAAPAAELASTADAKPAVKSGGEPFVEIATGLALVGLGKFFEKMSAAAEPPKTPGSPKV